MDILLEDGQHKKAISGLTITIVGVEEIIQQVLIRLSVKKGSFPYELELGSQFYKLKQSSSSAETVNRLALGYAQEALRAMPEITVESVNCQFNDNNTNNIRVEINYKDQIYGLGVDNNRFL